MLSKNEISDWNNIAKTDQVLAVVLKGPEAIITCLNTS